MSAGLLKLRGEFAEAAARLDGSTAAGWDWWAVIENGEGRGIVATGIVGDRLHVRGLRGRGAVRPLRGLLIELARRNGLRRITACPETPAHERLYASLGMRASADPEIMEFINDG